jgi:hypothetical protein
MNNDMKCPFCQQELEEDYLDVKLFGCENQKCKYSTHYDTVGTKELWLELIRTRKALELAITGLKNCKTRDHIGAVCRTPEYVDKILEQITALEQKE